MKHKTEDFKISAVHYYLKNKDDYRKTCKIFGCTKSSLQRWVKRYEDTRNLTRKNRKPDNITIKDVRFTIDKIQIKTQQYTFDKIE